MYNLITQKRQHLSILASPSAAYYQNHAHLPTKIKLFASRACQNRDYRGFLSK